MRDWILAIGVFFLLGAGSALWHLAGYLISPPRRALQDYHRDWLERPAAHGLSIRRHACLDGRVPCLLAEPEFRAGPAERGRVLRTQLAARGQALAPYGEIKGTLVLLHGRKGRKEDLLPIAERFAAAGFRCLLLDLPGHGDSPLAVNGFAGNAFEGRLVGEALAEARRYWKLPEEPAGLWGMSMGGAFAARAALESAETWRALVLVNSYDSLEQVLREEFGKWLGPLAAPVVGAVERLAEWRGGVEPRASRPLEWARRIVIPAQVVHGGADQLVPPARGRALFEALASAEKHWLVVDNGDHHRVLTTPQPVYAEMAGWFLRWLK